MVVSIGKGLAMKIVLLGGGSAYFEQAVAEIATEPRLEKVHFAFHDRKEGVERMDMMRRIAERIVVKSGKGHTVSMGSDLGESLDGADYAICSIGVHGPEAAWHLADVVAAERCGIIHTTGDTTGPGGLSQGLRIVPVILGIAREMERRCPGAVLLNHSNPMAPVCRTITKYTKTRVIGYCHNAYYDLRDFAALLGVPRWELDAVIAGVNHCGWLLGLSHKGTDLYPALRSRLDSTEIPQKDLFAYELFKLTGVYPIGGSRHLLEFFPHSRVLQGTENLPYGQKWRKDMIEERLLQQELNKDAHRLRDKADGKVEIEVEREGSPEAMGHQIASLSQGPSINHFVNIPNEGAISNLPPWAVVELKAVVGGGMAKPLCVGELPPQCARWTLPQIYAHELTVDAAVERSREKAIMALASDPMIRDFHEARRVFDVLVEAQGDRLKDFR